MLKYRGSKLIRSGIIGVVLIVLVIAVGLQPERLAQLATSITYQALFSEAGGLRTGDKVTMSGLKIGAVSDVRLRKGKALITFRVDSKYLLGSETTAHIRTGSLLGARVVTLESAGGGVLHSADVIPVSRTSSPYSLTDAVSDLTANSAGTDTAMLNQSLNTLSATLDQIAPQLQPTFDGVSRLSQSLNSRNHTLSELLKNAGDVTATLSRRSRKIDSLILNANDLLGVLVQRRNAIASLLATTAVVGRQLSGLVADNEKTLAPALDKLNSVTALLEKNRDNIAKAIPGLAKYQMTLGEAVSNGFYYNAFVGNLATPALLQPFLDYAFGFRAHGAPGRPPDNAGPRATLPVPFNGIPGGSR